MKKMREIISILECSIISVGAMIVADVWGEPTTSIFRVEEVTFGLIQTLLK